MKVKCPQGHASEIMGPNTSKKQLVGVSVDAHEQTGAVTHDTVIVECPECHEHFEAEVK